MGVIEHNPFPDLCKVVRLCPTSSGSQLVKSTVKIELVFSRKQCRASSSPYLQGQGMKKLCVDKARSGQEIRQPIPVSSQSGRDLAGYGVDLRLLSPAAK